MKKKNHIKVRLTILLCIPVILLCAAPCGWAISYDSGENDVREDIDWLHVETGATVNLYANVSQYIYAYPGSVLNIYSGNVALYIIVMPGEPYAVVTVYGTDFGGEGNFSVPGQVSFSGGILTGDYGRDGGSFELTFISSVPIYLMETAVSEVEIDIKPGSDLNSINLRSKGVVPVAVFTIVGGLDAGTIDLGTVLFAGTGPVRSTLEDVDEDGDLDMLFHFKTQYLNLVEGSTKATLTGTAGGVGIELTDTVRIVQSKKE